MTEIDRVELMISDLLAFIERNETKLKLVEEPKPAFWPQKQGPSHIEMPSKFATQYKGPEGRHRYAMQLAHEIGHYFDFIKDNTGHGYTGIGDKEYGVNEINAQAFAIELAMSYGVTPNEEVDKAYIPRYRNGTNEKTGVSYHIPKDDSDKAEAEGVANAKAALSAIRWGNDSNNSTGGSEHNTDNGTISGGGGSGNGGTNYNPDPEPETPTPPPPLPNETDEERAERLAAQAKKDADERAKQEAERAAAAKKSAENAAMNKKINDAIDDFLKKTPGVLSDFFDAFRRALGMSSPLILDLDGKGINTTNINMGIYFDHDGNLHAEKTAWVSPTNGILAVDWNKNGTIDNGSEVFGNHTKLENGKTAANGFEGLRPYDTNGDGIIDENDEIFSQLRIWVDGNSNGISDEGELLTLAEAGVKSINLGYANSNYVDENGNQHAQQGFYTKTDGTTAAITDVWFKVDLTDTKDTLKLEVTSDVASLVNIVGFGNVHDLHNAMMLDQSGRLKALVSNLTNKLYYGYSFESLMDELNEMIYEWAGVSGYAANSRGDYIDGRMMYAIEAFYGQGFTQAGWDKNPGPYASVELQNAFDLVKNYALDRLIFVTKIEPFLQQSEMLWNEATQKFELNISTLLASFEAEFDYNPKDFIRILDVAKIAFSDNGEVGQRILNQVSSIGNMSGNIFEQLVAITFTFAVTSWEVGEGENGYWFIAKGENNQYAAIGTTDHEIKGSTGQDWFYSGSGISRLVGGDGSDTYLFSKGHGQDVIYDYGYSSATETDTLIFTNVKSSEVKFGRRGDDLILFGYHGSDQITIEKFFTYTSYSYAIEVFQFSDKAITYDDLVAKGLSLSALSDNDVITGWNGINLIETTTENHTINTNGADDIIHLGSGNHIVNTGSGNDTIYSGSGNNVLEGGMGSDTYVFLKGHGQDIVSDNGDGALGYSRNGAIDTIKFTDVNFAEVKFARDGNHLIMFGYNGADQITIENILSHNNYRIDVFQFADRTITLDELITIGLPIYSREGETNFTGWNGVNFLTGGSEDQTITTYGYDDVINTGGGNNKVYAGYGSDTIYSGSGNNVLEGGMGSDTYVFSKGHGQDIVSDNGDGALGSSRNGAMDTIKFTDVDFAEVKFARDSDHLIMFGYNGADKITIEYFFSHNNYRIDLFQFNDKTVSYNDIMQDIIPAFTAEDQASLLVAQAELDAAHTLSQVMSPASYLMKDELFGNNGSDNRLSPFSTTANKEAQADIAKEVQSLINAMASFGSTEGSIQIEDQTYGYLTPITVSNY